MLAETPGQRGRFDLLGAITGTGGLATLVYGGRRAVADSIRSQAVAAARAGHPAYQAAGGLSAAIYRHALGAGFARAIGVSAGFLVFALIIAGAVVMAPAQRPGRHSGTGAQVTSTLELRWPGRIPRSREET